LKKNFNIKMIYKFSDSKDASEYSFGGEDGLDETPIRITNDGFVYLGSPKWSDLSIYTSRNISDKIILRLGMTNIFDNHYRTFASGISAPGRSFQVGLNLKL